MLRVLQNTLTLFSKEQPKQHIYLYFLKRKNLILFKINQIYYIIS
nr:MAG TPA: hypothetical protein [Caudoviricetes sp.]